MTGHEKIRMPTFLTGDLLERNRRDKARGDSYEIIPVEILDLSHGPVIVLTADGFIAQVNRFAI